MRRFICLAMVGLCIAGVGSVASAEPGKPPATAKKPVTEAFHGTTVTDDYRWLENANDPAVKRWIEEQNRYTRTVLDKNPALEPIRQRVKELLGARLPSYGLSEFRGGKLFGLKRQPPKQQPFLITLKSADEPGSEHVIIDPNKLNPKGTTSIQFLAPSLNGRLVAVALSEGGSEEGTLHVYDVESGAELSDVIPRVNFPTAGGSVAWNADASGFYYTRYPAPGERAKEDLQFYQQVYFHKLATPVSEDTYVLGKEFPRIAETVLATSEDGRQLLATVANGDGGEFAHYLMGPDRTWAQITKFQDQITKAVFGSDDSLYLLSHKDAPRGKILKLALTDPRLDHAKTVVQESGVVIDSMTATANRLYVLDLAGGPSQIRILDREGREQGKVPTTTASGVAGIVRLKGDDILFLELSYLDPATWYSLDSATGKVTRTALYQKPPVDFSDCTVVRDFAVSKDGTKVPLNIVYRKGTKLDGRNPTLLTGYGGFGISLSPHFLLSNRIWLEQGGVYAIANLRGGGEFGEEWHKGGNLTHKQNVFDDFVACARYLIDHKYTSRDRLAIEGGSNGGLLVGAALTQRPDLFRAVVCHVGVLDMFLHDRHPNGAFNVPEYGTAKDPEQFKAIYAYSPYQHVKDGKSYPAVLLLTGVNDGRVDPANSFKMTARLQAATSSGRPVILRVSFGSGHGIGTGLDEAIAQQADGYGFLFGQLGMEYKAVQRVSR